MLRFYLKGLFRDRSRSLMPIIVVAVGVTLVVLMHCWVTGILGDMIVFNARFATGHVKVMSQAYNDNIGQQPNDLALMGTDQILQDLEEEFPGVEWVERIQFGGLVDVPDKNGETRAQGPGGGMAIDLFSPDSKEVERLNLESALVRGRLPQVPEEILQEKELPKKYVCFSQCFRTEAGQHGSETPGIFRLHQFEKVEMVYICKPEDSWKFLEEMRKRAEKIVEKLIYHTEL